MYANIDSVQAEQQLMFKNIGKMSDEEVYELYLAAYDNEPLAMEMRLRVIESRMREQK